MSEIDMNTFQIRSANRIYRLRTSTRAFNLHGGGKLRHGDGLQSYDPSQHIELVASNGNGDSIRSAVSRTTRSTVEWDSQMAGAILPPIIDCNGSGTAGELVRIQNRRQVRLHETHHIAASRVL